MKREEIDKQYKWTLEDMYKTNQDWQNDYDYVLSKIDDFKKYQNQLNVYENFIDCLNLDTEISRKAEKLYVYSRMRLDEDIKVKIYQEQIRKMELLLVKLSEVTSFIRPEISKLDKKTLIEFKNNKRSENFSYILEKLIKNKKHILSKNEEKIISQLSVTFDDSHQAFSMLNDSELDFGKVKDEKSNLVKLTHGNYSLFLQSKDQKVRKQAYKNMFSAYKKYIETISVLYQNNVKIDCTLAKLRKYKSAMDMSVQNEDVTIKVYNNLIKVVDKNLNLLHDYCAFRADYLKQNKLNMYDLHMPLFDSSSLEIDYEKAKEIVLKALEPMGEKYINLLKKAFTDGWIDVYENDNKRSGAYSFGCYDSKPYVLLNYYPTVHDIFTIAHELGHSIHSYKSRENQPYEKAQYEIFVAEVASTVNEVLLIKYLLKNTEDKEFKKYLLSYYLDMFRTTLYRQTQFAEFEKAIHNSYEKDIPITSDFLNNTYFELNKKYYGKRVLSDDLIKYEWSRIPHFYSSFYVYKYATGIISAVRIANLILSGKKENLENYNKFLSLGGSMSPVEILKVAGVDLEKEETYSIAFEEFEDTLNQLRSLCSNG